MATINQLLAFNQKHLNWMKENNIELTPEHRKTMRTGELLMYMTNILSILMPIGLLTCCFHPMEPTKVLIEDWFEIDWTPKLILFPYIFLILVTLRICADLITIVTFLALIHFIQAMKILDDITPESIYRRDRQRIVLQTKCYGTLDDTRIVDIYRTQRLFSERVNGILKSVLIAFHQVALVSTAAIMFYFAVKFNHVIIESGILAFFVIGGAIATPLIIVWFQSTWFGALVDMSEGFKQTGKDLVARKTFYRRFVRSCQPFYIEEAYPFYHFDKETFSSFCAQALDYAITLLLW